MRLPTPGTSVSAARSSSSSARRSAAGECTERIASASFGPDAGRADQRLERVALVARREPVEHHRVLAHVQVREQERGVARVERRQRAERHEHAVADAADLDEHLARSPCARAPCRAPSRSSCALLRHAAAIAASSRRRAGRVAPADRRARSGARHQWHSASASASAASGGSGTSRRPSRRGDHRLHLAPCRRAPSPVTASFTSLGLYCTTGTPAAPGDASASPLACPTDIAVRAFTWNSTRSTATAAGAVLGDQRVELALRARRAGRAAGRAAACGSRRRRRRANCRRVAAHDAVAAARDAGVDARARRAPPGPDRTRVRSYERGRRSGCADRSRSLLAALAALEASTGARASDDQAGDDRGRAACRPSRRPTSEQVDRLGLLRLDLARAAGAPATPVAGVGAPRSRVGASAASAPRAGRRRGVAARRARRARGSRRTGRAACSTRRPSRPRPNCATLPVIVRSVSMLTRGAVAVGDERDGDRGLRVALAARVATLGLEHDLRASASSASASWPRPCTAR